jgi:hypothetical protein
LTVQQLVTRLIGRRGITKQRMQDILSRCPDDAIFVVPAPDHSYRPAGASAGFSWLSPDGTLSEDCEDDEIFEGCHRIPVVVIE